MRSLGAVIDDVIEAISVARIHVHLSATECPGPESRKALQDAVESLAHDAVELQRLSGLYLALEALLEQRFAQQHTMEKNND